MVRLAREHGLDQWVDIEPPQFDLAHPLVVDNPAAFDVVYHKATCALDPRQAAFALAGDAILRPLDELPEPITAHLSAVVAGFVEAGVKGLIFRDPFFSRLWLEICARFEGETTLCVAAPSSPGSSQPGFVIVSDQQAVQPGTQKTIVDVDCSDARGPARPEATLGRLRRAVAQGNGVLVSGLAIVSGLEAITGILALLDSEPVLNAPVHIRPLTGAAAPVAITLRTDADFRNAGRAVLVMSNTNDASPVNIPRSLWSRATSDFAPFASLTSAGAFDAPLDPGEVRLVNAFRRDAMRPSMTSIDARDAAKAGRVIIGAVTPSVDGGRFPVKTTSGDVLSVEADIFADGHEHLAAELVVHSSGEKAPLRIPMAQLPNDRWRAPLALNRIGRHQFSIEAWLDVWGGYARDLEKKRSAGLGLALEVREGVALLKAAQQRSKGDLARQIAKRVESIEAADDTAAVDALLSSELAEIMTDADDRPFRAVSFVQPLDVERIEARFASWYELFPRSITSDAARPGTLLDVIDRLPAIRDMGFDVLYFPPIHPIGVRNRKGRNNSTTAQPGEPGSPYAIGSDEGGHDSVHPELGTLADFQTLLAAAASHGMELALDFAIQCSPDHPWLKQHPDWFAWRPDGTIKYAENPPKKYQDIVNVDFYATGAVPGLWEALRDVVLFWVGQGVKTFRVDNPHTKPLPFWQWMIGEVRGKHPDVIFLSEAFTRPKPMYHLAKVGFSQSYTYFTWRHSKAELTEYLTELNVTGVKDYFRPHFFVNTPDINPFFLQTSGRAGFLIRAALATTLSGLWGMYSGFELCEAEPLPDKEEYLDSEKFQVRPRNWQQPGNIIAEISQLNAIRKAEPALQSHLGLRFHNAFNDQVLYFAKTSPDGDSKVLVAISLDPHHPQEASFEAPVWEWGLPDYGELDVTDLLSGQKSAWYGKMQHVRLTPDAPYAIWNVRPRAAFQ